MESEKNFQTAEQVLAHYGFEWENPKPEEKLIDAVDKKMYQFLKDHTSDTSKEARVAEEFVLRKCFNVTRKFQLVDVSRLAGPDFREKELMQVLGDQLTYKLIWPGHFEMMPINSQERKNTENVFNLLENKKFSNQEKTVLNKWIPGFEMKLIFQKQQLLKEVEAKLAKLQKEIEFDLKFGAHMDYFQLRNFSRDITDVLIKEMFSKHKKPIKKSWLEKWFFP